MSGALTNGGLTLLGNGILSLTSTGNTYTLVTNILGGTLVANNASNSATGTGAVNVASGGTLAGSGAASTGFITGGVTVNNGGTLSPSNGGITGAPGSVGSSRWGA